MASARVLIGGAATAALSVRVARSLYGHWRLLPPGERRRLGALAEDAKQRALALRGVGEEGRPEAEAGLRSANESLARALLDQAEHDPELAAEDLDALRDDLRRELARLAQADGIEASRGAAQRPATRG